MTWTSRPASSTSVGIPLQLRSAGYAPLERPAVSVFGRLASGMMPAQATAEIAALTSRVAATSPETHQHLRPREFPYGATDLTLRRVFAYLAQENELPFWIRPGLEPATVIYAALLAVVAAGFLERSRPSRRPDRSRRSSPPAASAASRCGSGRCGRQR